MEKPVRWECELWRQIKAALEEAGRLRSSYYVMAQEAVKLCERRDGR